MKFNWKTLTVEQEMPPEPNCCPDPSGPPSEIEAVTGFMFNRMYYKTEKDASAAWLAHRLRGIMGSGRDKPGYNPYGWQYDRGWDDAVNRLISCVPELKKALLS